MKTSHDFPPQNKILEKEDTYKVSIDAELDNTLRVLHTPFLLERLGGVERSINKSLVPALFNSPDHAFSSANYLLDYFVNNNIPAGEQLQILKGIQLSLNDIQLLADDKEATYDNVQFAYQWAGRARDEWRFPQNTIKSILDSTIKGIEKERTREDISCLSSIYLDPENMLSKKSKIERFMQNVTPNLIDQKNHIYHYDPTGENPLFLKLDTEEKRKYVKDFLLQVDKGWRKMFEETPTVKMYTHYPLPDEFKKFVLPEKQVKNYFPHIAFGEKEDILRGDMKNMLNPGVRDALHRDIGIDLTELGQEQAYFVEYISHKKRGEITPLKNFVSIYNKEGIKTFISCAHNPEMGDKIITIGEKLAKDGKEIIAQKVFAKYGDIIDNVNKIVEFTQNNFTKEIKTNPELIRKVEETLYVKGKQLLSQVYEDLNNENDVDFNNFDKQLDRMNADTITTLAIFKQAVKNGEQLPIESIEGSVFSKKEAINIPIEQQNEMLDLYEENWKSHPDREFVGSLKDYFKTAFNPETNKQKNTFYLFEKDVVSKESNATDILSEKRSKGDILHVRAFVRFEKKEDESLYASALNVDDASKNFGLGEAMMDEALTLEAREHVLRASCRKDNPSNMRYFEKGFISNGFKKTNNTEEFDLVWDEEKNKNILAKSMTQERLKNMYLNGEYEGSIIIRKVKTLEKLHSTFPDRALVRCFKDSQDSDEWYGVYEIVESDYGTNRGEVK